MVSAAAISLLLVAGTILAPLQSSYAAPRTNDGLPDTSSLKDGIRNGISVNLEHRNQHMNQENVCYRDNRCRQSDVGQNTLGNDNQVTGFVDQSDNIQQSAASPITPSAANQTTGESDNTYSYSINRFIDSFKNISRFRNQCNSIRLYDTCFR